MITGQKTSLTTDSQDSGLLRRLQELLMHLQDESQRLRDATQFLDEENRSKTENIFVRSISLACFALCSTLTLHLASGLVACSLRAQNLDKFAKELEDRKADKAQLQSELEPVRRSLDLICAFADADAGARAGMLCRRRTAVCWTRR